MFKKLKDKIAEEVKISPQRMQQIQQFTQSVTDKLQQQPAPAGGVDDGPLFSISEDDVRNEGFTNVPLQVSSPDSGQAPHSRVRRNSNSSVASDISFLPRYEPSTSYQLQSDLDVSASEVEDNLSQSSQLGHVSKEQVHLAFQKAQMRYHKYRGRYTDLANHYKELERENVKMKSVLVDTQDKAIRRVSELKEQCSLSQKAKADLEGALRTEIEEKVIIIDTLKQKVDLLQTSNSETNEPLLLTNGNNNFSEELTELHDKNQELKASAIIAREQLDDAKRQLAELEEREKSNNLKFAKSKMDLHTELQNRELEITNLKQDLETMRTDLDGYETGNNSSYKAQNLNLIEKCENLKTKCHEYEAELLKLEQYKLEITQLKQKLENLHEIEEANVNLRNVLQDLRSSHALEVKTLQDATKTSLVALQEKINNVLGEEYAYKEAKLREEFSFKLQQLTHDGNTLQQTQIKLLQAQEIGTMLQSELQLSQEEVHLLTGKNSQLEGNYLNLMEENNGRQVTITQLNAQVKELQKTLTKTSETNKRHVATIEAERLKVEESLQKAEQALESSEDDREMLETSKDRLTEEILSLSSKIVALKEDKQRLEALPRHSDRLAELQDRYEEEGNLRRELEMRLETLETQLDQMAQAEEALKDEIEALITEKKIAALIEQEKLLLERQLAEARSTHVDELQDYERQLTEARTSYVEMSLKLQEHGDSLRLASEKSEMLLKENFSLLERLKVLENEKARECEVSRDLESLKNENSNLKTKNAALEATISELTTEKTQLQASMATLETQNTELYAKQSKIVKENTELQKDNKFMRTQLTELTDKYVAINENTIALTAENREMRRCLQKFMTIEDEIIVLQTKIREHKAHIVQLTDEKQYFIDAFNDAEVALKLKEREIIALTNDLEQLQHKMDMDGRHNEEIVELKHRNEQMSIDNRRLMDENDALLAESSELKLQLATKISNTEAEVAAKLSALTSKYTDAVEEARASRDELDALRLEMQVFDAAKSRYEAQGSLLEKHCNELEQERQLLKDEIVELKTAPLRQSKDYESMQDKLAQYKSIDQTNRASIEFYEGELQKMQVRNEKLNRKLDETLVTLAHCADLTATTEVEYLRNVLYNYMLGKEGPVLARVIAAVCKFDREQTEAVMKHEQHKQSLLGQLGIL